MSITGAIVLFSVTWFMVFFIVLPLRVRSQDEAGEVVPGTPRSAPAGYVVVKKAKLTTLIALVVWAGMMGVILAGPLSMAQLDRWTWGEAAQP